MNPLDQSGADEENFSSKTLEELRQILKQQGHTGPRYIFNAVKEVAETQDYKYVFWLDLMGARNVMKISLPKAARSVMKIHAAALLAKQEHNQVEINPVMDGVYGYVDDREVLEAYLQNVLTALTNVFVQESVQGSRFMVRAGVSFGPLIAGASLAEGAKILKQNKEYLGGTAIGMAISHAYEAEGMAPPFGVYIHESARAFAPTNADKGPYLTNLWRWHLQIEDNEALSWALKRTLVSHFDWLEKNPIASQYDPDALRRHRNLAIEYFKLYALDGQKAEIKK